MYNFWTYDGVEGLLVFVVITQILYFYFKDF